MAVSPPSAAAEAYRLMRAGRLEEALVHAERSVAGARVCLAEHGLLASILLQLGRTADAERVVAGAAGLKTGVADAYDGLAYASMRLGRHDRANTLYRRAAQVSPEVPRFWYNLACSERSLGRLAEAEAACDRSLSLDGAQYPTYLLRSELRVQSLEANHIAELQAQLGRADLEERARVFLGYALAKELDDVGRFDEAFHWFAAAAAARRARLAYDVAVDERKLQRIEEAFPRSPGGAANHAAAAPHREAEGPRRQSQSAEPRRDAQEPRPPIDSSRYIFIVGLPRSGTTLVERILSGLPAVRSNGETENFSRALLAASGGAGDVFERAAAADPSAVAANYARAAPPGAADEAVIEKLPMNYLYLGAIHRALPDAKLLLVRRSPLDSCFAMYRTLFGEAYPFSYDFEDLARYYAAYERLLTHWRGMLGGRLHEIVYEDLVRDPRRIGASVATHCGLAWSDAALDIQNNQSASLTASASQIRRPIYGTSSGRWRHYLRHLQGLIAALRRHGAALPEEA